MHACGRQDVQTGRVDRRVLATLEFLSVSGLKPTVSGLRVRRRRARRPRATPPGHRRGDAVDISAINGIPIAGHQGPGSIADTTIRKLLTLQGSTEPQRIVSLIELPRQRPTRSSKAEHARLRPRRVQPAEREWRARGGRASARRSAPSEWIKLIARLGEIPDPTVAGGPSRPARDPRRSGSRGASTPGAKRGKGQSGNAA